MSDQNQNATPAELSDESLENVAGGVYDTDGGCVPTVPVGCWPPIPIEPTISF